MMYEFIGVDDVFIETFVLPSSSKSIVSVPAFEIFSLSRDTIKSKPESERCPLLFCFLDLKSVAECFSSTKLFTDEIPLSAKE